MARAPDERRVPCRHGGSHGLGDLRNLEEPSRRARRGRRARPPALVLRRLALRGGVPLERPLLRRAPLARSAPPFPRGGPPRVRPPGGACRLAPHAHRPRRPRPRNPGLPPAEGSTPPSRPRRRVRPSDRPGLRARPAGGVATPRGVLGRGTRRSLASLSRHPERLRRPLQLGPRRWARDRGGEDCGARRSPRKRVRRLHAPLRRRRHGGPSPAAAARRIQPARGRLHDWTAPRVAERTRDEQRGRTRVLRALHHDVRRPNRDRVRCRSRSGDPPLRVFIRSRRRLGRPRGLGRALVSSRRQRQSEPRPPRNRLRARSPLASAGPLAPPPERRRGWRGRAVRLRDREALRRPRPAGSGKSVSAMGDGASAPAPSRYRDSVVQRAGVEKNPRARGRRSNEAAGFRRPRSAREGPAPHERFHAAPRSSPLSPLAPRDRFLGSARRLPPERPGDGRRRPRGVRRLRAVPPADHPTQEMEIVLAYSAASFNHARTAAGIPEARDLVPPLLARAGDYAQRGGASRSRNTSSSSR